MDPVDLGEELLHLLGLAEDAEQVQQAEQSITIVTAMVVAYCRGKHLDTEGEPRDGIREVVLTAAARLLANPEQLPYTSGSVTMRGGFTGFSLIELTVLNRYRVTAR